MRLAWVLVAAVTLAGCNNACQQICVRMGAYARDCGYEVRSDDVQACISDQAGAASRDDRAVCRQQGSRADIRSTWTCDDLEAYFDRTRRDAIDTASPDTAW